MEGIYDSLSDKRKQNAFYMINLGKLIVNCVTTAINVKQWYTLKTKLLTETDESKIIEYVDKLIEIGEDEIKNAEATIPLVQADSRLGWEPSMEYMTDEYHLRWKIKQVKQTIEGVLPVYKNALKLNR